MDNEEMMQEEEFIDVKAIALGYLRYFRKRWILLLILGMLGACCGFLYAHLSRYAEYSANATYNLEKTSSVMTNASLTARLAEGISTITATSDFHDQMNKVLGVEDSDYTFYAYETTDANILTVYVTSDDMELTNQLLENFADVYTPWATSLIGNCTLKPTDQVLCTSADISGPSRMKMLMLGGIAGAVIWFLLATLYMLTRTTILNASQMEKITMSTCMGLIPEIEKKKRDKSTREPLLMSSRNINHDYQQSLRQIRYELEKQMEDKKVILFTSTMEGEGKSLITLNLAFDLKKRGKKVIVINADFNHNGISELLLNPENGDNDDAAVGKTLLDYLTEDAPIPENLAAELVDYDGLSILYSSRENVKNLDYLNGKRFIQILASLRDSADYILIDTAPVEKKGDAILFSEAVDAVWYIVRYNFADASRIRKGMEPFYRNGTLKGYIINRTQGTTGAESYGGLRRYGYGYGYGYGKTGKTKEKKERKDG